MLKGSRGQPFQDSATTTQPPISAQSSRPYVAHIPSPQSRSLVTGSNSLEIRPSINQTDQPTMHYTQATGVSNSQQWPPAAHYVTQPHSTAPSYAAYPTSAPQYHPLPNSLAPLLNDQTNQYIPYPATNSSQQNEFMLFQPQHYTDGPATMMWPMISLPQQDPGQQQDLNGNMKYT